MKRGINCGSGQRQFKSNDEIEWINVDKVSRLGMEPDLVCDGADLPYDNASVDYFVLHHVLEHFGCSEANDLIREAHRVLKPWGALLAFVPNMHSLCERWLQGQLDTQLFMTNVYGAYMGDEADRHKWGYDSKSLYDLMSTCPWSRIVYFNGAQLPGADIAQDWWILGCECTRGVDEHVLILTRNNLDLTKRTVDSVRQQNVPTQVYIVDNGSTDDTVEWAREEGILLDAYSENIGVSAGWNQGLRKLFRQGDCDRVLVVNNDVVLPPWFLRELISCNASFVTGVAVDSIEGIKDAPGKMPLQLNPDFSAFLIRRDCWSRVGPFDERMKLYASDCDYHARAQKLGVKLYKACVPYYHECSSTLNHASPAERSVINAQANLDRQVFQSIYNCLPGTPGYASLFE